jgi:hypothetical protein
MFVSTNSWQKSRFNIRGAAKNGNFKMEKTKVTDGYILDTSHARFYYGHDQIYDEYC